MDIVISQGLLGIYTLIKFFSPKDLIKCFKVKKNTNSRGLIHSKLARSDLWALSAFSADIILCGPPTHSACVSDFINSHPNVNKTSVKSKFDKDF